MRNDRAAKLETRAAADTEDRLLSVRDVAARLRVSTRQVWKLASWGRLPKPVRLGRSVRWRESDIRRFVARGQIEGARPMSPRSNSADTAAQSGTTTTKTLLTCVPTHRTIPRMATVALTPDAADDFDALPLAIHGRVLVILERLGKWPHVSGAKPLRGTLAGRRRIRTGDYRVQFHVAGRRVIVEKIGHRDRFYED
jgi:mRNA interferase RelE/StbE